MLSSSIQIYTDSSTPLEKASKKKTEYVQKKQYCKAGNRTWITKTKHRQILPCNEVLLEVSLSAV